MTKDSAHFMLGKNKRKKIILTADDFGKSEKANRNILKLARIGKLERVSVIIDGDLKANEVKELLSLNIKIDIHFELIWQKRRRNMLANSAFRQVAIFLLNYIWGDWHVPGNPRSGKESVSKEWERQIEKFREIFDRLPDGISSHEHSHFFPAYFRIATDLAEHFGIFFIRFGKKGFPGRRNIKQLILSSLRKINARKFFNSKLDSSDNFSSLDWIENIDQFLKNIPKGETEIACHPERNEEFDLIQKHF